MVCLKIQITTVKLSSISQNKVLQTKCLCLCKTHMSKTMVMMFGNEALGR